MIRVCSGFSPSGSVQYGQRFLASFDKNWPSAVELQVYVEEPLDMPRNACRSLWQVPGAFEFNHRHQDNLAARGKTAQPCWKSKEVAEGYSFRTDAYKFWKQIVIPQQAAVGLPDGAMLIWLDADVETIRPVTAQFFEELMNGSELCYLGRSNAHSEIGFWAVRMNPMTRRFLAEIAEVYTSDQVFTLREWHSAFVWDYVRTRFSFNERNITPPGMRGHVWPYTPLARFTRHDKGPRKPK